MKTLNEPFTDKEFKKLQTAKHLSKEQNWHDFILTLIKVSAKENKEI